MILAILTSDYISIAAVFVSGLAAIAAIVSGQRARKDAERANKSALDAQGEANRVATEATRLQALEWTSQYFSDVRAWGDECSNAISEAIHLSHIRDDKRREESWNSVRSRLSALVDRGRWYFPNRFEAEYGIEKPPAYRGLRQRILDYVVAAYDAYPIPPAFYDPSSNSNDVVTQDAYGRLVFCQRGFVSEIQDALNPRHREKQVEEILEQFGATENMRIPSDDDNSELKLGEQD